MCTLQVARVCVYSCVHVVTVAEPGFVHVELYLVLYGTAPSVCGYSCWAVPQLSLWWNVNQADLGWFSCLG